MHLIRIPRRVIKIKPIFFKNLSQVALLDQNEYTETPEYPPILDMSLAARKRRKREEVFEKIKKIHTVEEKQIALNMPRFYGWKCVLLNEKSIPYNALPLVKCYTRSHFIPMDQLPEPYAASSSLAEEVCKEIKSYIEDAIAVELDGVERCHTYSDNTTPVECQKEDETTKLIVKQINRIITNNLTDKVSHILSTQVDYDPRHEAFWFVGGVDIPDRVRKWRKKNAHIYKNRFDENLDRPVQYIGSPFVALRSNLPLKPIIPYSEAVNTDFKVSKFTYQPESVGYFANYRHGTNVPGYWPGDYDEFGLLSYHGRGYLVTRKESYGEEDHLEALQCQAMKASYGWLLAQANYQGFTTYNDITYPLVTQTVITNGKIWSFFVYQLNTILMNNEYMDENPKHNICFGTKPMTLYETIENGKVKGLNEDVLKMLIQFYLNAPEKREYNMKPYLGKDEEIVADIEDDNRRCWLENRYKHLVSNRPRHFLLPEVHLWERIFKIEHNTRFFEKKRKPYDLGVNPFDRRLDDHLPPYIPKVLRPYPRSRKKFETTYYPDV